MCSEAAERAFPALAAMQRDRDYWVKHTAADVLQRITSALKAKPIEERIEPPKSQWPNASVDVLLAASQDADREVRQAAVEALSGEADPRAVEALHRALDDTDLWVRRAAARGLQSVEGPAGAAENPLAS
jgi:HEAT repeat protein